MFLVTILKYLVELHYEEQTLNDNRANKTTKSLERKFGWRLNRENNNEKLWANEKWGIIKSFYAFHKPNRKKINSQVASQNYFPRLQLSTELWSFPLQLVAKFSFSQFSFVSSTLFSYFMSTCQLWSKRLVILTSLDDF